MRLPTRPNMPSSVKRRPASAPISASRGSQRTGIAGFSKGGTSTWQLALETVVADRLPAGLRYRLHVPFYPACTAQYRIRPTGAPIYPLLGGRDTYVGVEPCLAYAAKFKAAGAPIETRVYPNAAHGFDGMVDDRRQRDPLLA